MNEKKDRTELNRKVTEILRSHIAQKGLKQSDLLRLCKEKGYSLNQSELSRILSNNISLSLYPILALADVLEIDPAVKSYIGKYSTLFHSTDTQESNKILHGRLLFYPEHDTTEKSAEAYCAAVLSVDTGIKDMQGNPVLKKYQGRFIVSKHLDVGCYTVVSDTIKFIKQ